MTERTGDMAGRMFIPIHSKPFYTSKLDAQKSIKLFLRCRKNKGLKGEDFWIVENDLIETNIYPIK
jgi:hypothetical protein